MTAKQIKQAMANLQDELDGATLYEALASAERAPRLAELYGRFAQVERQHAQAWRQRLAQAGVTIGSYRPSWRTRALAYLGRRYGVKLVLPTVVGMEQSSAGRYAGDESAASMAAQERSHARLLGNLGAGGLAGSTLAQIEGRHRAGGGNALRAAVLGANDGLVSNLSLVMGVAGAGLAGSSPVLIAGLAGLLAGACSMALGEWLSVQSSREFYQRQIDIERQEIEAAPEEEAQELALIYESRGLAREHALAMAHSILKDRKAALETLTREELGINPQELGGSAYVAAGTSFGLFAAGAIIPVIPFFFLQGYGGIIISAAVGTVGLFTIGAATSLFTGRSTPWSGLRMVIFGLAAAAITFGVGRLIGTGLAQ